MENYLHEDLTRRIIASAIEVHRHLGPGLLESTYEECFCHELALNDIMFERQQLLSLCYKGLQLDNSFRIDLLVEQAVIIEIKTVEKLLPVHEAQLLTYLRLSGKRLGLLINFNSALLKDGIKRLSL
jgi:GxxExxY protein